MHTKFEFALDMEQNMDKKIVVKTEEMDDPATCIPASANEQQHPWQCESTSLSNFGPINSETEVKKEEPDTFTQPSLHTGCAMCVPHSIKEEEKCVISSYSSLANDQSEEDKRNHQLTNVSKQEDGEDASCSRFTDTCSHITTCDRNSAASFTDKDIDDKCVIVKAETGEFCEVIDMSKESNSLEDLIQPREKPFKCDECDYCCERSRHLKIHKRIHTGEKPFKCDECDFSSSQIGLFKSHKLIHSGEKPFKCDECEYSCHVKGSLKTHKLIHSGNKQFKCNECDFSCHVKGNLKNHKSIHTGEKPL